MDPSPAVVELPDGALSYADTGSGRAVVAVHGIPATGRDFRWLDAALGGRVRFIRLDLPGFGASPVGDRRVETVDEAARVVVEFCDALALDDAVVLGHSLGGPVAVAAAGQTHRISAVALVNSAGPKYHRGTFPKTYRAAIWIGDLHPMGRRAVLAVGKPIARWVGFSKHLRDDELVRAARINASYRPRDLERRLSALDKPVLVAWAEDDPAVERRVSLALLACAREPTDVRFATGGHNLQSRQAVELADALVDWAQR